MKLIEFLFNNWYIAIVVFFLASSFLKRLKGGAGSSPPPKQAMPPFGGGGGSIKGWSRDKAPTITSANLPNQGKDRAKAVSMSAQQSPDKYAKTDSIHNSSEKRAEVDFWGESELSSTQQNTRTRQKQSEHSKYQDDRADAQKLAQGIIWAEILGPPRAKKPFRK
ncbi:hypothetical protein GC093_19850 [Paenibacillus sp. LMG 31456]|uniref:Uncharacterized protein n=1 Tax=Paenibacillus foliorum TaxID=2654974 RepID=A0A972GX85_9BACL|nr:hypothetical protein [Paenibacillus foliorum]NOU95462.1 hypothetical protein [Paenibacillus foliorum]